MRVLLKMHRAYDLPMLVVTHQIEDAAALATHLVALNQGRVAVQGAFAQVSSEPAFRALLDAGDVGAALPAQLLRRAHMPLDGEPFEQALWLRADHVLIAVELPRAISARNVLEGEIAAITQEAGGSHLVELSTRAGAVLSRLTEESVDELQLSPGKSAWALIKAHAL